MIAETSFGIQGLEVRRGDDGERSGSSSRVVAAMMLQDGLLRLTDDHSTMYVCGRRTELRLRSCRLNPEVNGVYAGDYAQGYYVTNQSFHLITIRSVWLPRWST